MTVNYMTEGESYIAYTTTEKSITFGDEDLTVNLKTRQRDEIITLDICYDRNKNLVIGAASGFRHVAQVVVPAIEYDETTETDSDGEEQTVYTAKEFDIDGCTINLFTLD